MSHSRERFEKPLAFYLDAFVEKFKRVPQLLLQKG